ncbi:protein kinase [Saccharobesus litoralis]|uniref:Protein kinase n=1 Tax=Saccharobesus litoralis TaxID=2172099 RepID=A0A2S0VW65_9ALTE|nr:leucine-rich repeat-containing protein kinase family protein [Saccharobesus litoralis]AWB68451.1 protein kinase [Saccharobesus litoralis]
MHTLEDIRAGKHSQEKRLNISQGLTEFPIDIIEFCQQVEILDIGNNQLTDLPNEISQLKNLKVLFASNNQFSHLPEALGQCEKLEMVGFKSNQIKTVSAESLPQQLRWLILTDNQIETLPEELGNRPRLQKCALAGNKLSELPQSMANNHNLQLLRVSANQLKVFPKQLLKLPKLAWLAFAGNPFCQAYDLQSDLPIYQKQQFEFDKVLGMGASGIISLAHPIDIAELPQQVAIKVFKGDVTSDGYPADELSACLHVGEHRNLVKFIGRIEQDDCSAVVMELIPDNFHNLGLPPSLASCTRDTFADSQSLSIKAIEDICSQMANMTQYLAQHHMQHGDLYAHNVLIDADNHALFGDFGAASHYEYLSEDIQQQLQKIEGRALGYFIEDLLSICVAEDKNTELYQHWYQEAQRLINCI